MEVPTGQQLIAGSVSTSLCRAHHESRAVSHGPFMAARPALRDTQGSSLPPVYLLTSAQGMPALHLPGN